jgi:hypothetical protein
VGAAHSAKVCNVVYITPFSPHLCYDNGMKNPFRRPTIPASESMVVTLHKMDKASLIALKPKWAKIFGPTSPQVARIQALITSRENA